MSKYHSKSGHQLLAERDLSRHAGRDFTDLWQGLQVTFHMVRDGAAELGIFGYNGMLFDDAPPQSLLGVGFYFRRPPRDI